MAEESGKISEKLINIAMAICGLTLSLSVPGIWFAWTNTIFFTIMAIGAAAGILFCLAAKIHEKVAEPMDPDVKPTPKAVLSEEFMSELTRTTPYMHHHMLRIPAVRRRIARLRDKLSDEDK